MFKWLRDSTKLFTGSSSDEELDDSTHQYVKVQNDLKEEIEKLGQKFPQDFPKPIDILETVDDTIEGQWEQRLQQAGQVQIGTRIALIPYYLGDLHWTGVFIEFKETGQIERAEFIDPVAPVLQSDSNLMKLREEFAKVYPEILLQSRELQVHEDVKKSAELTVANLLQAAEECQLTIARSSNVNDSNDSTSNDLDATNGGASEESNPPNAFVFGGDPSEKQSNSESGQ
ncbi:unnamed protein product, partial [Rotaria sp. Silwood1]